MTVAWLKRVMNSGDDEAAAAANQLRNALVLAASSVQYDSTIESARQMGVEMPPERFAAKQQKQNRMDGGWNH